MIEAVEQEFLNFNFDTLKQIEDSPLMLGYIAREFTFSENFQESQKTFKEVNFLKVIVFAKMNSKNIIKVQSLKLPKNTQYWRKAVIDILIKDPNDVKILVDFAEAYKGINFVIKYFTCLPKDARSDRMEDNYNQLSFYPDSQIYT